MKRCPERATDEKTLDRVLGGSVLNECYVDVTLPRLRELGDDTEERNRFMLRRSKFLYR